MKKIIESAGQTALKLLERLHQSLHADIDALNKERAIENALEQRLEDSRQRSTALKNAVAQAARIHETEISAASDLSGTLANWPDLMELAGKIEELVVLVRGWNKSGKGPESTFTIDLAHPAAVTKTEKPTTAPVAAVKPVEKPKPVENPKPETSGSVTLSVAEINSCADDYQLTHTQYAFKLAHLADRLEYYYGKSAIAWLFLSALRDMTNAGRTTNDNRYVCAQEWAEKVLELLPDKKSEMGAALQSRWFDYKKVVKMAYSVINRLHALPDSPVQQLIFVGHRSGTSATHPPRKYKGKGITSAVVFNARATMAKNAGLPGG
jgi:hypothetical protein